MMMIVMIRIVMMIVLIRMDGSDNGSNHDSFYCYGVGNDDR